MPSKQCVMKHRERGFAVYAGGIAALLILTIIILLA